jgi:hypothetical protein
MKNITKIIVAAAVAVAITQSVQATPITGGIGLSGYGITLNNANVETSTEVLNWGTITAGGGSGSLAGVSGTVTMGAVPWLFNSSESSFWSVGGFTFNLISSVPAAAQYIGGGLYSETIYLAGTVSSTNPNFSTTAFTGLFSIQDPSSSAGNGGFLFAGSFNFNSVPDGGTTALLLGSVLSGLALIRRKLNV